MKIGGKSHDSGGAIIHSENFYAKALTQKVGMLNFNQEIINQLNQD